MRLGEVGKERRMGTEVGRQCIGCISTLRDGRKSCQGRRGRGGGTEGMCAAMHINACFCFFDVRHRAWERGGKNSCSEGLEGAAARAFEPFDKVITKREDLTFFRPFIGLFKKPF